MGKVKEGLYNYFVRKNGRVWYEYERYVREHMEEHHIHRLRHIKLLMKLNWFYRVKGGNTPYFYWDVPLDSGETIKFPVTETNVSKSETTSVPVKPINSDKKASAGKRLSLPYLDGAESMIPEHEKAEQFVKRLLNYDVISFDMFDTLVIRPFTQPKDLFLLLQAELDYLDFANIREKMERIAKERAFVEKGIREVDIYDIYFQVNKYTNIDIDEGVNKEFEIEYDLCLPNPYMLKVYRMLKEQNKKIIVTSDMYLTSNQINKILKKCGYDKFDNIFISCEYSANKSGKGLYKIISAKYENKSIIHIGDNYKNDILNARESGWNAVLYKGVHDLGKNYRASYCGMSELTGSTYGGVVDYHLLNGEKAYSPLYEYGFMYGGLYVFGFCQWIHKYKIKNDIEKILFISRDGAIYQKIYDMLFDDHNTDYLYWSRINCAKVTARKDKYDFLLRIVEHRKNDIFPMTIEEVMKMLSLESMVNKLDAYRLHADDIIIESNIHEVQNFFIDNWDEIVDQLDRNLEPMQKYLKYEIGNNKKVSVVDIGWQGSGLFGIKWLVENMFHMDCEVHCLLAGSKALSFTGNLPEEMKGKFHSYLFSRRRNRDMFDFFAHSNNHTNTGHFEVFTQAQAPTFMGIKYEDGNYKFEFGIPEVENKEKISEIHKGMMDFCILYKNIFKKYPYVYDVSGYDAIQPFRHISKNLKFIEEQLGDFVFSRNICANFDKPYLETIKDVLVKQGVASNVDIKTS